MIMRPFVKMLACVTPLCIAACASSQTPPEPAIVDHRMHTPHLVTQMMLEQEARALRDSTVVHAIRAGVDAWNQGNLEAFLAL